MPLFGRSKTVRHPPTSPRSPGLGPAHAATQPPTPTQTQPTERSDRAWPASVPALGYTHFRTDLLLPLPHAALVLDLASDQIISRGLMERQLFSTKSFDLDPLAIRALIRRIAQTVHGPPAQAKALLLADFRLASVHDLAAILKWALARLIRSSPPSTSSPTPTATATPADRRPRRGLVDWQAYLTWRAYEHGASHAPQAFQAFLSPLPPSTAALLDRLFHLLARTLAFAVHNGNSAPRLAALFAPLLFGLAPDMAFHPTYDAYCKIANATQHLLLAYVRYQAELDSQRGIHPSLIIQDLIQGYHHTATRPLHLSPDQEADTPLLYIRKNVRSYAPDLMQAGSAWNVTHCPQWQALIPPAYSESFRHRLAMPASYAPSSSTSGADWQRARAGGGGGGGGQSHTQPGRGRISPDDARYRSLVDKKWGDFIEGGFGDEVQQKLTFDPVTGPRRRRSVRQSAPVGDINWSRLGDKDFHFGDHDLSAELTLDLRDDLSAAESSMTSGDPDGSSQGKKAQGPLPFPYDIHPKAAVTRLHTGFIDVFIEILVSNDWARQPGDPNLLPSSWTLIELTPHDPNPAAPTWVVFEEFIPETYLEEVEKQNRKVKGGIFSSLRIFAKSSSAKDSSQRRSSASLASTQPQRLYTPPLGLTPRHTPSNSFFSSQDHVTKYISLSPKFASSQVSVDETASTNATHLAVPTHSQSRRPPPSDERPPPESSSQTQSTAVPAGPSRDNSWMEVVPTATVASGPRHPAGQQHRQASFTARPVATSPPPLGISRSNAMSFEPQSRDSDTLPAPFEYADHEARKSAEEQPIARSRTITFDGTRPFSNADSVYSLQTPVTSRFPQRENEVPLRTRLDEENEDGEDDYHVQAPDLPVLSKTPEPPSNPLITERQLPDSPSASATPPVPPPRNPLRSPSLPSLPSTPALDISEKRFAARLSPTKSGSSHAAMDSLRPSPATLSIGTGSLAPHNQPSPTGPAGTGESRISALVQMYDKRTKPLDLGKQTKT